MLCRDTFSVSKIMSITSLAYEKHLVRHIIYSTQKHGDFSFKGFGLRSESGRSEAQAERRLERSRSATPPPSRRRKPAADAANPLPLVTSARFCGVARASSRGKRGDGQPVERSKPRVGHGGATAVHVSVFLKNYPRLNSRSHSFSNVRMLSNLGGSPKNISRIFA